MSFSERLVAGVADAGHEDFALGGRQFRQGVLDERTGVPCCEPGVVHFDEVLALAHRAPLANDCHRFPFTVTRSVDSTVTSWPGRCPARCTINSLRPLTRISSS